MRSLSLKRFPGTGAAAAFFFAYLYLPIVVLIVLSFNENRSATIWTGFSLKWYGEAFDNPAVVQGLRNSLVVATIATIVSTVVATLAALGMEKRFAGSRFLVLVLVSGQPGSPRWCGASGNDCVSSATASPCR